MTDTTDQKPSPIEVWLRPFHPDSDLTGYECRVVRPDESTYELNVDSLSMRGAQREITGYFIDEGYQPVGRWQLAEKAVAETYRTFKSA